MDKATHRRPTTRGFKRAASLVEARVRKAAEGRGFAVSRLLTQWVEVVGPDLSQMAQPVEISYSKGGMGATLTVLTTGAQAPILQMKLEDLRRRVNACYGSNAIARIRITQTAKTGFYEGQATFAPKTPSVSKPAETPGHVREATEDVEDDNLRLALARLGTNVATKS